MRRVLVEHGVALVLLRSVKLALELAHGDFDAVGAGAAALLHVAAEETRCGRELPVEDVVSDGKASVELGHCHVEATALLGGDETQLDLAGGGVIWIEGVDEMQQKVKQREKRQEMKRRGKGRHVRRAMRCVMAHW